VYSVKSTNFMTADNYLFIMKLAQFESGRFEVSWIPDHVIFIEFGEDF